MHWQLALWGYFLFGFEPVVPLLRSEFGLSRTVAGLHGSAISLGTILAGLAYPRLCARFGRRRTGWLGVAGMCGGLVVLCTGRHLGATLVGALLAGGFGALLVAGSAAILSDNHGLLGAAAITETNAVCAGAGLLGPLVVGAAVAAGLGWRVALSLLLIPAAIFVVRHLHTPVPDDVAQVPTAGPRRDRLPRPYWFAWLVVVALEGVEFSMTFWAADLLRTRVGLSAGAATAAVGAIVGGMFVGRMLGTILTQRQQVDVLLLGAVALAGVGFTLFWIAKTPTAAIAALALTGAGMSLHYPLAVSRAVAASGGRADRASGRIAIGTGCAGILAPPLLGALGDSVGLHRAFLVVPMLLVAAAVAVCAGRT
ncbi:MAG TPA: MFS transporter [Sporichthyaceae bacterium]|nr:MFS transporter [Sporichthyaceae bacterium]